MMRSLAALLALLPSLLAQARSGVVTAADKQTLKPLISVEQQATTSPFPARVTLHLHNSGRDALWLYRRARSQAQEGSALEVRLEPEGLLNSQKLSTPARGGVLESAGLPHPRLVRLSPDEDYEEKLVIQLSPAVIKTASGEKPIWGRYHLAAIYRAKYSNADEIRRNLGLRVWQGEVTSNTVDLQLQPHSLEAQGSAAGTVVGSDGRPVPEVLVSLSDQQERLVSQMLTATDGRFSFSHLLFGFYWVTVRQANSHEDTAIFRHAELTAAEPAARMELMMLPQEIYEAKKILHRPVLFRITDASGQPLDKVLLEVTWSNGPVLDSVKGQSLDDGTVALELIAGRNFVTLKRRNCPKQEERVDVPEGPGIDGFKLSLECARK